MIRKISIVAVFGFFAVNSLSAKAKIPLCFPCETIQTVQELPTDSEIQKLAGEKVNLSYLNNEYGAIWIPVWNTDGRYVLSDISNNTYYEIDSEVAAILKDKHDFDVETAVAPLTFWKKIGGKIVFLLVVVLAIWGSIPSKKKEVTANNI